MKWRSYFAWHLFFFSKELSFPVSLNLKIDHIPFHTTNDHFKVLPCCLGINLWVENKSVQTNNNNKTVCLICAHISDHMLLKTHRLLCCHESTSGILVFPPSTEICSQFFSKVNTPNSQPNLCVFSIILVFLLSESKHTSLLSLLHFPGEVDWEIDRTLIDDIGVKLSGQQVCRTCCDYTWLDLLTFLYRDNLIFPSQHP